MKELRELFEKLELSKDVLDDLVKKVETTVETQVKAGVELAKEEITADMEKEKGEWREAEIQKLEEQFEEYKETIVSKFSDFVDQVITEEIEIPERVKEFARKGQIYEPIIEEFKTKIAIDQGLIDEEVKSILKEAKDKIIELEDKHNETYGANLELREELSKSKVKAYLLEKCDELTLDQKSFVKKVLGDADSVEEIDEKFDIVLEQADLKSPMSGKHTEGTKGPGGDDDAAKKKEKLRTHKDAKKVEGGDATAAKENPGGSEGDDETMGSQGDRKLDPKKEVPFKGEDEEGAEGKGLTEDTTEEDEKKEISPLMEEYRRLTFKKS
jgi:hypothetical protein